MIQISPLNTLSTVLRPQGHRINTPLSWGSLDVVRFSGQNDLLKRYGIANIDAVSLDIPPGIKLTKIEKKQLVVESLKIYEHARKKRLLNEAWMKANPAASNVSGRNFSSTVVLENGLKASAVNAEFTRDDILCGERSAIVSGLNQAIQKLDLDKLQRDPAYMQQARSGMKIKRIIMSGAHRQKGDNPTDSTKDTIYSPPPCSDCQAWMATDEYFSKDTQIVTLNRDNQGQFTLSVLPVGQMLPLWGNSTVSKTTKTIDHLPIQVSPQAETLLNADLKARIRDMLNQAKQACEANPFAEASKKNGAVSALFSPINEIVTASRFDITARWYNDPAKSVLEAGFRRIQERGFSTNPEKGALALAFAFYGDYPQPTVNTLGYLSQLERSNGADHVLIARIENDTIQIRTIREMLPQVYMSARVPREGAK